MQNFFEYLNSPQAQRGLDMIAGISPRERAQIMMEENKVKAYQQQEAANQRLGQILASGDFSDEAIKAMAEVNPEYAWQMKQLKQKQEEQAMQQEFIRQNMNNPEALIQGSLVFGNPAFAQSATALMTLQEKQDAAAKEAAAAQRLSGAPQGGGYLSSGLDVDLSGVGGQAQKTLPPIDGLDSVPAAPLDPQANLQRLLKEYEDLARDPASGTTAFQNAMKAKKEEIDIAKSQVPSPQDTLKLQEAEEKRAGGKQVATEALYYANKLLSNKEGLNRATGQIGGYIPNVLSESAANAEADLEALRSALTADKLSLMTGVLTDKDIEMLKNIAAGGIGSTRGDARVVEEVARIRDTLQKNLLGQEKGKANPNSAAGLRAEAQSAIAKGASLESVSARFKQLTGEDL